MLSTILTSTTIWNVCNYSTHVEEYINFSIEPRQGGLYRRFTINISG
jgi:hypothetical protein